MSTRGFYTFKDTDGASYHVYKHSDNYPTGAADALDSALLMSWRLPRFEADEFAAAFVAANKWYQLERYLKPIFAAAKDGYARDPETMTIEVPTLCKYEVEGAAGGVRLISGGGDWKEYCPWDVEYHYEISHKPGAKDITVKCSRVTTRQLATGEELHSIKLFFGTLTAFKAWAEAEKNR